MPMMWFGGRHWTTGFHSHHWAHPDDADDARAILDRRYASGELTPERYQAMRAELSSQEGGQGERSTPGRARQHERSQLGTHTR
jgi:hypothetical protein